MDRFAGAISSAPDEAFDFDRVWRDGLSSSPSRVGGRSLSDSDVIAVDVDAIDKERRDARLASGIFVELLILRFSLSLVPVFEVLARMPPFFRRERVKVRAI